MFNNDKDPNTSLEQSTTAAMPKKGDKGPRDPKTIEEAVRRHLEGREQVTTLCREYKISRAGFYNWVKAYKDEVMRRSMRAGMTPKDAETSVKADLLAEIAALKTENRKLRDRLVATMLKQSLDDI